MLDGQETINNDRTNHQEFMAVTDYTVSVNHVKIRLTSERWSHIVENHNDMAGYYYDVLETIG